MDPSMDNEGIIDRANRLAKNRDHMGMDKWTMGAGVAAAMSAYSGLVRVSAAGAGAIGMSVGWVLYLGYVKVVFGSA